MASFGLGAYHGKIDRVKSVCLSKLGTEAGGGPAESEQACEPFAKFGSALGQPWVSPWERGRPARILVKALPRRQSAGEPTNPVKPIATTLPSLVRAGRPRSQGSQPFPAINPAYWRILQKALVRSQCEIEGAVGTYTSFGDEPVAQAEREGIEIRDRQV